MVTLMEKKPQKLPPASSPVPLLSLRVAVHIEVLGAPVHIPHQGLYCHLIDDLRQVQVIKQKLGPAGHTPPFSMESFASMG
jgi:hypothetical protein